MEFTIHLQVLGMVFLLAVILGAVANKTNFCTMGAVSDWVNMGDTGRIRAWLFAMTVALLGVMLFEYAGKLALPSDTFPPYRTGNFAWLRYVLGGVMFGIGMTLGSGCGNKTLIRIGGGNIKSVMVLVIASIANPLITLAVFSVVIVGFLSLAGAPPSPQGLALFLVYCAALTLLVAGFSLAASVLFLRYRDLNQVWDLMVQAGFFVAPIIYPLGIVPERLHFYFYLWPPTPIIEFSRAALVSHTVPSLIGHVYLALEVIAAVTIGVLVMRRYGPRAAEYV